MNIPDIVVGIDPDMAKSGVAVYNVKTSTFDFKALEFPELVGQLDQWAAEYHLGNINVVVVVEAAWVNKAANYHGGTGAVGQQIAYRVGINHEAGMKIVEMCKHFHIPLVEQKPLRHKWKKGKISAEEFNELTGHKGRSNQDCRDAVLLCLHHVGVV